MHTILDPAVPLGGVKPSGIGREFDDVFVGDFTELESVVIRYWDDGMAERRGALVQVSTGALDLDDLKVKTRMDDGVCCAATCRLAIQSGR